jgi:methyl-accepting chemotaxis protein
MITVSIRRSLQTVRNVAQTIAAGDLNQRCLITSNDEVGQLSTAVNSMANHLQDLIGQRRKEAERDAFGTQITKALEMADTETEARAVVARAIAAITNEHPIELLLADSSRAIYCGRETAESGPIFHCPGTYLK